MQLSDSKTSFSSVSILVHWLGAILVIAMLLLGFRIDFQTTREAAGAARALHMSFGILLWVFLAARVGWRLLNKPPEDPPQHWSLNLLSRIVQYGLLACITVQLISGPLMSWSLGRPISAFSWFQIPSPLAANRDLHEVLETVHMVSAYAILGLLTLHILGALKHLVIDKDGVLQRMLWVKK